MKLFFALVFLALSTGLSAQIQKGSILLGGTGSFQNASYDYGSVFTINLAPSAGFFLSNRFVLGSSLNFKAEIEDGDAITSIGLRPFGRYYLNGGGKARFFGQADLGYEAYLEDGGQSSGALFGLGIGVDIFLNEHIGVEGLLGYQHVEYPEYDYGTNNIGLNIGIAAFINRAKK